LAIYLCKEYK